MPPGSIDQDAPDIRRQVDAALSAFLAVQQQRLRAISDDLGAIAATSSEFLTGGKRLRPTFCYWGWRASGRQASPEFISAAAALELLQACALIHDDVMDSSATRRGMPSVHTAYAAQHVQRGWRGDSESFGVGAAILLGDLFHVWSDQLFASSGLPPDALSRARPLFDAMRAQLMAGQYLDLVVQAQPDPDASAVATVLKYKSARYTVEHPLQLGALLAGAQNPLVAGLGDFGLPLGEAFQLRDDLLGVLGDPTVTGKPAGDDLRQGKHTLLVAEALARADGMQRATLRHGLGRRDLDDAAIDELRRVLTDTGAVARIEEVIAARLAAALAVLDRLALPADVRSGLSLLAGAAAYRVH